MSTNTPASTPKLERDTNRALLIFYDALTMLAVWFVVFVLHPSLAKRPSAEVMLWHLGTAAVCFFAVRFLFRVYRQILRVGNMRAFAREMASGLVGGGMYVLLSRFVIPSTGTRFITAASFALAYIVVSILIRIAYYYLYHFAKRDNPFSRALKEIMRHITLVDFDSKEVGGLLTVTLEPALRDAAPINEIQNVAEQFAIRGDITSITQITKGYINRTYRIETLSDTNHVHKYVLQRINTNVFRDPDALMENYKLTTRHLYGKYHLSGDVKKGSVQTLRYTKDGRSYYRGDSGCWRMVTYFDDVYSLDIPDSPETFYYAGKAFGEFIMEMADVPPEDVKIVIPNFHNTRSRYEDLERAIAEDPKGRVADVEKEIAFVRARKENFGMITDALESGRIPTRVCHNDCNLNNILFDNETHLPVAVIDLDTVMPSSPLYDYGDSMRIGTNTAVDDEKDLSKVSCDLNLYESYARGYLEACGKMLTKEELELLPYASLIITSEDGIRFLMDHINGDTYYNIFYFGQNLDRSRTQLKLLSDMEKKLPEIVKILQKIYDTLDLGVKLDGKAITEKWKIEG